MISRRTIPHQEKARRKRISAIAEALRFLIVGGAAAALCMVAGSAAQAGPEGEITALRDVAPSYFMNPSEIEVGVLYNQDDSFYFSDFKGTQDERANVIGNLDLWGRGAFDGESTRYWHLKAANTALDSRVIRLEYGHQGRFGLVFDYEQLPKLQSDSGFKFMGGDGGTALTLPAGWVAATTPAGMTELPTTLNGLEVEHERRNLGAGLSFIISEDWKMKARFDHQTKKGTKTAAGVIAASGGNPRAVLFGSPINYGTNQFDIGFERATDTAQFQVQYYHSHFTNRDESVLWENPYASPGGWNAAAAYPTGLGQKALPPDNQFDQVTLAGGYNLPARSRITLNAAFGRMTQDETFLPYTVNPALSVTTPLPRQSLDGEINTTVLDLRLTSTPVPDLTLNASYRYDDRDNNTPHDTYIYIPSDATDQGAIDGSTARINHPISYKTNEFGLGARYRIARRTDLTLDYEHETIERTFAEVSKTKEDGLEAKLRTRPFDSVSVGVNAGASRRRASTYHDSLPYLTGHSPEYIALQSGVGLWENHPLLRRFYLWDREKQEVGGFATWMPVAGLSLSLNANTVVEDFDDPEVGLTDRTGSNVTLDVSFSPVENMTTYAFYSFDDLKYGQNGWSFQGFAKAAQSVDPDRRWSSTNEDQINTVGLGFDWALIDGKIDLAVDYLYAKSNEGIDVNQGPALGAPLPFPDTVSRLHNLHVGIDYAMRENVTIKLGYLFEKYALSDWSYTGVGPETLSQVVSLGETTPDDSNHMFTWSVVYRFW